MFAVIYRAKLKPGKEEEYKELWHLIANYFKYHCGALGSCLHKTSENIWLAYSRWPDKETRDAVWSEQGSLTLPIDIQYVIQKLKECFEEQLPEICLEVVDDLL